MALADRITIYQQIESLRGNPVIAYVTSARTGAGGQMAADVVAEIAAQLEAVPSGKDALDFVIVSNGGDPTVAWRIVTMVRERFKRLNVLVPQAAFSAATLVALGADEIVMHPYSNLGPVDPQIRATRQGAQGVEESRFGSEDLAAFLAFAKKAVGITDQEHLSAIFQKFCDQVGTVPIGVAARSSQLSLSMGEKLLKLHMNGHESGSQVKTIAERLSKDFFHHGYALGRREATEVGLPIAAENRPLELLLWQLWLNFQADLQIRRPFAPLEVVRSSPAGNAIFGGSSPTTDGMYPPTAPTTIPQTPYELVTATVESCRLASRLVARGVILAGRTADFNVHVNVVPVSSGWEDVALPASPSVEVEAKVLQSDPTASEGGNRTVLEPRQNRSRGTKRAPA